MHTVFDRKYIKFQFRNILSCLSSANGSWVIDLRSHCSGFPSFKGGVLNHSSFMYLKDFRSAYWDCAAGV